jgi:hypothetical protein
VQQDRPIALYLQIGPQKHQNLQIYATEKCAQLWGAQAAAAVKEAMDNITGLQSGFMGKEKSLCEVEKKLSVEFSGRVEAVLALGDKRAVRFHEYANVRLSISDRNPEAFRRSSRIQENFLSQCADKSIDAMLHNV